VSLSRAAGFLGETYGPALDLARGTQLTELAKRRKLFRSVQPPVPLKGRSVIVVDDGVASGVTMIAALRAARAQKPLEVIAVAPVMAPDALDEVRKNCNDVVTLLAPEEFHGIASYYSDFKTVTEDEAVELLQQTWAVLV
jgi:putative phosphoribosyl transferase